MNTERNLELAKLLWPEGAFTYTYQGMRQWQVGLNFAPLPDLYGSPEGMLMVIEKMRAKGWHIHISSWTEGYRAMFLKEDSNQNILSYKSATLPGLPQAVAEAATKALEAQRE